MLKKNTRKRLLAGALATVMMLTMCPSWALADDEDIATLPAVEETTPVVDSAPAADPIVTPDVPSSSETEAPAEDQNTAPAPSDDGANGGTDVAESGNSTNSTVSEDSENNSQNNDAVSNAPENEIASQDAPSHDAEVAPAYLLSDVTKTAECWVTNRHAADSDGNWKTTITNAVGDGADVTTLATPTIEAGNETYVFWQARVLPIGQHQSNILNGDRTKDGTEIDRIRYVEATWTSDYFEYREKDTDSWKKFKTGDQLVFYYLVRTDYSEMVQIDVSDWTVNEEPSYDDRRSVTYQIIVDGGVDDGKVLDSKKFWYNKAFKVSSIRVREIGDHPNYSIDRVVLEPSTLGDPTKNENGEYRFSLDLNQIKAKHNATVNIYVTPNVEPHKLTYVLNDGEITSAEGTYTPESLVYPDETITTPTVEKAGFDFGGWYTDAEFEHKWEGKTMPNENLTLYAKWIDNSTPVEPEPELTPAKYFVLLPTRDTPKSGKSQGEEHYLPSSKSDGGVAGKNNLTGYPGAITAAGQQAADDAYNTDDAQNGVFNADGYGYDYLRVPTDLGFFTKTNWSADGKTYIKEGSNTSKPFSVLGDGFNVNNISIVWYTIKRQGEDGSYHVDGYVTGVPVTVTYHPNYGTIPGMSAADYVVPATSGDHHIVLGNTFTAPNGYEFGGWYTDAACTKGNEVTVGFDKLLMNSWNLYAKWVPTNFKVSYYVDGVQDGEIEDHAVDSVVSQRGKLTKEGHTFSGWTPATDVASIIKVVDGKFTMPAQNVRFNGTFEINKYNVIYKVDNEVVGTDVYNFNSDVTIRPVPTKEGHTFKGWKIGTVDAENFTMPAHDVTIEGTFAINRYNVTYKVDGKEVGTDVYDFNSDVVIRDVPTKEGYTFTGWKIGTADAENFKMPAHDVTIEGTFAKNSSGGSSGGHHRRPTVTIPDEVPTGLNGNDHYAYIVGYPDKTVHPQNGITRAEVATIFFRLLTDETRDANSTKSNSYSDVAAGAWYNHAVSTLSAMGIVKGSNGKFNPNAPITRAEFAAIAARFDDKANTTTADFSDIASHWAKNEISAASNNGWITGYPDGTFRPDNKITRAEAMTLVNRVLKRLPETEEDLHDDMIKWSDNSDVSQWFYLDVQEATNSHYYQTKENQFEKWTKLRETRDWTELEK